MIGTPHNRGLSAASISKKREYEEERRKERKERKKRRKVEKKKRKRDKESLHNLTGT